MAYLIEADNLSKSYDAIQKSTSRMRSYWTILTTGKPGADERITVLQDIDLRIKAGKSVGLIGQNGAGKSTLLKMLTGVLQPSTGTIRTRGSMAALLELAAGFDMRQTGLQNIFLKNALLGIGREQTRAMLEDIIAFADIGDALHKPLKHYSSGMVVRLGFAIVSRMRPDLLITDEVLAVGDEAFQRKCIAWLDEYLSSGGTLLMVSHSTFQINRLCAECIWLRDGKIHMQGPSNSVTRAYNDWVDEKVGKEKAKRAQSVDGAGTYRVKGYELLVDGVAVKQSISMGASVEVRIQLSSPDQRKPHAAVGLLRLDGTPIFGITSAGSVTGEYDSSQQAWCFNLLLPNFALLPGRYKMRVHSMDPEEINVCDSEEFEFNVSGACAVLGVVKLAHQWQ